MRGTQRVFRLAGFILAGNYSSVIQPNLNAASLAQQADHGLILLLVGAQFPSLAT